MILSDRMPGTSADGPRTRCGSCSRIVQMSICPNLAASRMLPCWAFGVGELEERASLAVDAAVSACSGRREPKKMG